MKQIGRVVAGILIFILVILYSAFSFTIVLQQYWSWFAVTQFGLEPLTFREALAINLVVGVVMSEPFSHPKEDEHIVAKWLMFFTKPWLGWLVGAFLYWIFF